MPAKLACLIDANAYIFRAFFGMPPMHAPDGTPVNATYGFLRTALKVMRERDPEVVVAAFESGQSFRNQLYDEYKANRDEPPDDLIPQFDSARRTAAAVGIRCLEIDGYEADDVIGTMAGELRRDGYQVLMVTSDKDMAQLVGDGVLLYDAAKDRELDAEGVAAVFGVRPEQIVDYLALVGDSVDNIPGVRGIGPKTARALLAEFGSIEAMLADLERIVQLPIRGAGAVRDKIANAGEQLQLARELATIRRDVPHGLEARELLYRGADPERVESEFTALGFGQRIRSEITRWVTDPATTGRLEL
jgi:DNA polymerase-1